MPFCTKCGAEITEEAHFCPNCGQERGAAVRPEMTANEQDVKDNKVFAILAYFWLLVLVTIFAAPKTSAYARFHANQGLVLFITNVICNVAGTIMTVIIPLLGGLISGLLNIATLALLIIGVINAAKGEMKELPVVGQFKILN